QPLTREQFVSLVFTPIENTAVDAVLFSFGSGNVAEYESRVLEWPGQADDFVFPESKTWHGGIDVDPQDQYRNPKSLADAGHNPPAVVVEECHKRNMAAFVSLRMNDTHDGQHPRGKLPNPELPTFKRHNLDWLVETLDRWTALDYRRPQVRALKLRVIEEFFDRWDFDGIELDWLRHTLNFPRGEEQNGAKYLTDFMRKVRRMLDARAAARGRPIELAVRVPERLDWCRLGGYDVPTWIDEDLCDILILGQGLTELPTLGEFHSLMKARRLPVYPALCPYGNGYRVSPDEVIRGSAANLWNAGADGVYAFNWFHYGKWRKHLLDEIAEPQRLAGHARQYTLTHRFDVGRRVGTDYLRYSTYYREPQVPFELNVDDGAKTVPISVATLPKSAELWVAFQYSMPGDKVTVTVNDKRLEPSHLDVQENLKQTGFEVSIPPDSGMLGLPLQGLIDQRFQSLRLLIPPELLNSGRNTISIQLNQRGPGSEKSLQIARIELSAT
ncbi:MAG: hypothetical protein NT069_24465, partial [Planctomycetota bacterium]|nr:hypothetical protein [Planctomycetota bacterium]